MRNPQHQIERARQVHGYKYDYSLAMSAKTTREVVPFICPEHGEFRTSWNNHITLKVGCPKCRPNRHTNERYTTESWVEKADKIHDYRYDYSMTDYKDARTKVDVICHQVDEFGQQHGVFGVLPSSHLKGIGCPKCARKYLDKDLFIQRAKRAHNGFYDYDKVVYHNNEEKVEIVCPIHGSFFQSPKSHLAGCGCPKCNGGSLLTTDEFVQRAREVHGERYSKTSPLSMNFIE